MADLSKDLITDLVSPQIVDRLEPVQIDEQQRERIPIVELLLELLDELAARIQTGERIVTGEVLELLAHLRQLADVVAGHDDAIENRVAHMADQLEAHGEDVLALPDDTHPGLERGGPLAGLQSSQCSADALHVLVDHEAQQMRARSRRSGRGPATV